MLNAQLLSIVCSIRKFHACLTAVPTICDNIKCLPVRWTFHNILFYFNLSHSLIRTSKQNWIWLQENSCASQSPHLINYWFLLKWHISSFFFFFCFIEVIFSTLSLIVVNETIFLPFHFIADHDSNSYHDYEIKWISTENAKKMKSMIIEVETTEGRRKEKKNGVFTMNFRWIQDIRFENWYFIKIITWSLDSCNLLSAFFSRIYFEKMTGKDAWEKIILENCVSHLEIQVKKCLDNQMCLLTDRNLSSGWIIVSRFTSVLLNCCWHWVCSLFSTVEGPDK